MVLFHTEMGKWGNKRGHLDYTVMETPVEQLPAILTEFQAINENKSLMDEFSERFKDDALKQEIYKELGKELWTQPIFAPGFMWPENLTSWLPPNEPSF